MTQDHDAELRQSLNRHRAFATFLLILMVGLVVLAYRLPEGPATALLAAAAQAGVVGGIADWFAVTALFRRPLGLPIPHTAIIPAQKERLGRGLGRFIAGQVFTENELRRLLSGLDLASVLRGFLTDPASTRPAAQALSGIMPRIVATLEDGRARRLLIRLLPRMAGGPGTAQVVARALRAMMASGRHQAVLDAAVTALRQGLRGKEDQLREAIARRVRDEGGAVVGWMAGAYTARKILAVINTELDRMEAPDSAIRQAIEAWIIAEIEKLETDPDRAAAFGKAVGNALKHEAVALWLGDVWDRLRAALLADAARPDGRTVQIIESGLANAGALLAEDQGARDRVNAALIGALMALVPSAQGRLAGFVEGIVGRWDSAELVSKIELRVGRDLQYVRMNGTLVGFLAGGVLHLVIQALAGRVVH
ncbi:DUF445 domain-containing protein [Rhodovarius crocodyli]|uniref:DUF445 domain-containing protein n=1 Tax=Rhodovarius crocodyli TaxID=1979269 RepID=A0A437M3Y2_9PROT|nr:DUF445 domain-containing protein [Rhodovarius crocodyli]RVT92184.1 DUF445 domain-containing protein [Rhodovarius crocodyli]